MRTAGPHAGELLGQRTGAGRDELFDEGGRIPDLAKFLQPALGSAAGDAGPASRAARIH